MAEILRYYPKMDKMKKLLLLAMTGFLFACNNDANGDDADDTTDMTDTSAMVIDPNEAIPDSATIVNDSVIVPQATGTSTDTMR